MLAALDRFFQDKHKLRPLGAEAVERAAFNERFDRRASDEPGVHAPAEVEKVEEGSALGTRADDLRHRVGAAGLHGGEPEINFSVDDLILSVAQVDVRRNDLDPHAHAVVDVLDRLITPSEISTGYVAAEERRHEFCRVVRFKIPPSHTRWRIRGRVRLVKAGPANFLMSSKSSCAFSRVSPFSCAPLTKSSLNLAIFSCFFLLIALMHV